MWDYFPPELMVNILLWLPPRSLLRFRCVCKSWCSLISNPNFVDMHTHHLNTSNHNATITRILTWHIPPDIDHGLEELTNQKNGVYSLNFNSESFRIDDSVEIDCPFLIHTRWTLYSCNGLFLVSCPGFNGLWNPSIRRILVLGHPLLFGDGKCWCVSALGFNPKTNDYKVVCIGYKPMEDGYLCSDVKVYSVKEGAWRGISAPAPRYDISMSGCNVSNAVIYGAVHWIGCPLILKRNCKVILLFDMVDEVFRQIMLPESLVAKASYDLSLTTIGGSLSVIEYDNDSIFVLRSIWVMEEYGAVESWTKKFSLDLKWGFRRMLGVRENGEMVLSNEGGKLVGYNPMTRHCTNLKVSGIKDLFFAATYKESLALLLEGEQKTNAKM